MENAPEMNIEDGMLWFPELNICKMIQLPVTCVYIRPIPKWNRNIDKLYSWPAPEMCDQAR
jgi:hypothetical protein